MLKAPAGITSTYFCISGCKVLAPEQAVGVGASALLAFLSRREALGLLLAHPWRIPHPKTGLQLPRLSWTTASKSPLTQNPAPASQSAQCAQNFVSFSHLSDSRVFQALFYHPGSCGSERWATCAGSERWIGAQD